MSQCHKGKVDLGYSSSAAHFGAILCGDMTLPAVFSKVSLLLAEGLDGGEMQRRMLQAVNGEVTDKEFAKNGKDGGVISSLDNKFNRYFEKEAEMRCALAAILPCVALAACKKNKLVTLEELLIYDKALVDAADYEGFGILHAAVINYHKHVLEYLVGKLPASELAKKINKKTVYGVAPLDYCIMLRDVAAIDDFKRVGAKFNSQKLTKFVVADLLE